ncbi:MAG: histidine phosphatase family protein [Sphaerochaetaceae bacterium]|nr:histidine phosphatase family protein [Sphaerochaetaceae bacterium]
MKIYVARHGQTEWNALNKVCGRTDLPLTEEGVSQAKKLSEAVSRLHVDSIVVSPMKRALQTARVVSEENGIPYIVDDRLIEQDYGIYEGVDRLDEGFLANKRCFAYRYPQGESMMQVAHRTYSLLDDLRKTHADENILLVCHGGVARVIRTYFIDMTNEEFFHYNADNCSCTEYTLP